MCRANLRANVVAGLLVNRPHVSRCQAERERTSTDGIGKRDKLLELHFAKISEAKLQSNGPNQEGVAIGIAISFKFYRPPLSKLLISIGCAPAVIDIQQQAHIEADQTIG